MGFDLLHLSLVRYLFKLAWYFEELELSQQFGEFDQGVEYRPHI